MTEQILTERFIKKLGRSRADQLQHLWDTSYPHQGSGWGNPKNKSEVFEIKALSQGFSRRELDLFYRLP